MFSFKVPGEGRNLGERGVVLDKREADSFFTRDKRGDNDGLRKECCVNDKCSAHEREETAENIGEAEVYSKLCEYSMK